jgi:hypothetical protein
MALPPVSWVGVERSETQYWQELDGFHEYIVKVKLVDCVKLFGHG